MHTKNHIHTIYQHTATHLFVLIATLFMFLPAPLQAKVGGLAFQNPANSIEKRTSYSVFGDK